MTAPLLGSLGLSLALTLALELPLALLWGMRGRALLLAVLANLLTNPPAAAISLIWRWQALPGYAAAVAVLELLALWIEGAVYKKSGAVPRPYLFSLCANALSFGLGLALKHLV